MNIKTFVINLDRRPDRLTEFYSRYNGPEAERFSAFDGKAFEGTHELLDAIQRRHPGSKTAAGMFGCWMSHLGLWRMLTESNEDAFMIFEDDAFFENGFKNDFLDEINGDMNLIYFGGRFNPGFWPRSMANWEAYGNFWRPIKTIYGRDFDRTTHAYVITKNGAQKALELYDASVNLPRGITAIDGWLNENRLNLGSLDVFPHICHSPMNYQSDIQIR